MPEYKASKERWMLKDECQNDLFVLDKSTIMIQIWHNIKNI